MTVSWQFLWSEYTPTSSLHVGVGELSPMGEEVWHSPRQTEVLSPLANYCLIHSPNCQPSLLLAELLSHPPS